jgi:hypothetical protein
LLERNGHRRESKVVGRRRERRRGWGRGRREALYLVRSTVLALAIIVVVLFVLRLFGWY